MPRKAKTYCVVFGQLKNRGPWFHHMDCDSMDDAREERESLLNSGDVDATKIRRMELPPGHVWTRETVDAAIAEIFKGRER